MALNSIQSNFSGTRRPDQVKTSFISVPNTSNANEVGTVGVFGSGSIITNIDVRRIAGDGEEDGNAIVGNFTILADGQNIQGDVPVLYQSIGNGTDDPWTIPGFRIAKAGNQLGAPLTTDSYLVVQSSTDTVQNLILTVNYLAEESPLSN
jgi:hypothetical protein